MSVAILGTQEILWCFDVQNNAKFKVVIGNGNDIDDLKEVITKKCKHDFPPHLLKLWRVNTGQTISEELLNDELKDTAKKIGVAFRGVKGSNIRVVVSAPDTERPAAGPPSKRLKLNEDELNRFWESLKDASHRKYLKLANSTRFLGERCGVSALKIRKCYRDLLSVVFDKSINKLRITGNPGIGKTFFGYYLLYHLALQDATVVYDSYNEPYPIVFEGEKGAFVSDRISVGTYLRDKDVWYIVDGKEPKDVDAKTILICSPRREHYVHFDKYSGVVTIRYMQIWSWKEIKSCRKLFYADKVTLELARDLYSKWGGIPRYVLERANDVTHQEKLDDAIKNCEGDIFDHIGESCVERSKFSHMIVHIDVNLPVGNDNKDENGRIPYTKVTLKFASNYVKEQVTEQFETRIRERIREKTKAGVGDSLLGSSFEYMAHRILRNGGKFDVRPLDKYGDRDNNDPDAKIDLPKQNLPLYFKRKDVDVIKDGQYYQAWEPNFPSLDSVIAPNKVFQMTIATVHPIRMSGLKALYKKFGGESADHLIYYYFVVPEHQYDVYEKQKFVNSNDKDAQVISSCINDRVCQYVLKIKL